ncbi:beta strand repeat-containing protein [Massilia atriviolacea]|uniref:beta strand repeat-containing protein n=1 Tax=Massilia atriviolacea TaxID=2495579 RepID=UPI0038579361
MTLNRSGSDLILLVNATDKLTLKSYADSPSYRIESIAFADGTVWDIATVAGMPSFGTAGADILYGIDGYANHLNGMDGNDTLSGQSKADVLLGGGGNDQLRGYVGDDTLHGGSGSDTLDGASGNDTYIFELGDGSDTVFDSDSALNNDKVQFGAGIAAGGVTLNRSGSDLILLVNATDKLTLKSYADSPSYRIESIAFADGTVWDIATVAGMPSFGTAGADILYAIDGYANHLNGMDGNDTLSGQSKADVLLGGGGNDQLRGYVGDDTLHGGSGSDTLDGASGNDTYIFELGDGSDTVFDSDSALNNDKVQFGAGIAAGGVTLNRSGSDLILLVNATDKLTLKSYADSPSYRIESIAFADGTVWDIATVAGMPSFGTAGADILYGIDGYANHLNGMDGNDTLSGQSKADVLLGGGGNDQLRGYVGDDTLHGGSGSDTLDGASGNDTYIFELGDGSDTVFDSDSALNNDKVQFGAGIAAGGVTLNRSGSDLILLVNATDKLTLKSYADSPSYRIESIAFADGTVWDIATVAGMPSFGTAGADILYGIDGYANHLNGMDGNDTLSGQSKADVLLGGGGNDQLRGYVGDDTLHGGSGSDTLDGASGNDTYIFELGDGSDTVFDSDSALNNDKVQFGAGIAAGGVTLNRSGSDLILLVNATDKLTLKSYADSPSYRIESIAFADGTVWDIATVAGMPSFGTAGADILYGIDGYANHLNGMDGNDTLSGQSKADVLLGGGGNDQLRGYVGDDTLHGGSGSDTLDGASGNDTYIFELGDGSDTVFDSDSALNNDKVQFGAGIAAGGVTLNRSGSDLIVLVNATDKLTLNKYFDSSSYRIESIAFADGTAWSPATVATLLTSSMTTPENPYGTVSESAVRDASSMISLIGQPDPLAVYCG